MSAPHTTTLSGQAVKATRVRYKVLLLTFVTAFIMYIDRTCMGTATPYIRKEFGLDIINHGLDRVGIQLGIHVILGAGRMDVGQVWLPKSVGSGNGGLVGVHDSYGAGLQRGVAGADEVLLWNRGRSGIPGRFKSAWALAPR